MAKVPEQKGPIHPNPPTLKQMTYPERVRDREHEVIERRRMQTLDLHEPKPRRK